MKTCTRCKKEKSLDEFYKCPDKNHGVQSHCKSCESLRVKADRKANPQKFKDRAKAYRENNKDQIANFQRDHYKENREKIVAKRKAFYNNNKEKYAARAKARREANKEAFSIKGKLYREANKEKVVAYGKAHYLANKSKYIAKDNKRRAAKLNATPAWFEEDLVQVIYDLSSSMRSVGLDVHVDHKVPLQGKNVCGLHCLSNLGIIDAKENFSKGNRYG